MQEMHNDEIDLIDILRVLWQRKVMIFAITLVVTLAAAGISLVLPKVYEVSTIIEPGIRLISDTNGETLNEMMVVLPGTIKETIRGGAYNKAIQQKLKITGREYPDVKVEIPRDTNLVKMSIQSGDPVQAVAVLEELLQHIQSDIQEKLSGEKKIIFKQIRLEEIKYKNFEGKITLLEKQSNVISSNISNKIQALEKIRQKPLAEGSSNAISMLIYSSEIQNQQMYLNGLREKLKDLQAEILASEVLIENLRLKLGMLTSTNVTKEPTVPAKPVKPKKTLIVAVAGVLGLFGSMLLAFLFEAIKRAGGLSRVSGVSGVE
ncbi:Wzz/FepE/Etk N-terminal domain-containing protein [Desulfuromonas sp. AOP6]|uniref:Wzz/FepE/Etk N-terminal domain-containing protein n=1 Tax=Desulfuromonas sp. AOP6 TaxID=1566351 RepID=UPI0012725E56|nr:Wzz/FepE/Etk N-terminal domain-containing protein [Desulfuromonas sp. AOP6]BCA80098.1 hypothetical protein AOP6_1885 [Desulfuromonas sp. AOP6]